MAEIINFEDVDDLSPYKKDQLHFYSVKQRTYSCINTHHKASFRVKEVNGKFAHFLRSLIPFSVDRYWRKADNFIEKMREAYFFSTGEIVNPYHLKIGSASLKYGSDGIRLTGYKEKPPDKNHRYRYGVYATASRNWLKMHVSSEKTFF